MCLFLIWDSMTTSAPRRRGPSPKKTAGTRRDILAAGLDIFLRNGFAETRMADVAAEAGVAKGTLYLYFADKAALFEGVMREVIATPLSSLSSFRPKSGETTRAHLARIVGPIMATMESSGRAAIIRLVVAEGGRFPALVDAYRRQVVGPVVSFVRQAAERALAQGELRSDAPIRFPQLLMAPGLIVSIWNGLHQGADRLDGGALFDAYLDLIFGPEA